MPKDQLHRFLFETAPARGAQVELNETLAAVLSRQDYPKAIAQYLGELMAACALFGSILKFSGSLVLQMQGNGALKLLVVEWNADRSLRATAKWQGDIPDHATLPELLGRGQFVLVLDQKNGSTPYQGIVPLSGHSVADMLEEYMARSEQLATKLFLACDGQKAVGFLLQRMPGGEDGEDWTRVLALANTLTREELLNTNAATLRHRLFHEESLQVFQAESQHFSCDCSRDKVADMLQLLGKDEVFDVLNEQGSIAVHCQYCGQHYVFDDADAAALFPPQAKSPTTH